MIRYAKSSFSDASGCVEVALLADGVFLRDSKNTSKEPHHLLPTSGEHSLRAFEMANSICHDCRWLMWRDVISPADADAGVFGHRKCLDYWLWKGRVSISPIV